VERTPVGAALEQLHPMDQFMKDSTQWKRSLTGTGEKGEEEGAAERNCY